MDSLTVLVLYVAGIRRAHRGDEPLTVERYSARQSGSTGDER